MNKKLLIIMFSLIVAVVFTSGGYGYWQKNLVITSDILVIKSKGSTMEPIFTEELIININTTEENSSNDLDDIRLASLIGDGYIEDVDNIEEEDEELDILISQDEEEESTVHSTQESSEMGDDNLDSEDCQAETDV